MSASHTDVSALNLFENEITELSTKLMTALERMLELEQENLVLHRELQSTRLDRDRLAPYEQDYGLLTEKLTATEEHLQTTMQLKTVAEASNAKLSAEVEDLTASLFSEANQMVTDASQETLNFKKKNQLLRGELEEKNVIIDSLQEQLADLKKLFFRMEDEQARRGSTFSDQDEDDGPIDSPLGRCQSPSELAHSVPGDYGNNEESIDSSPKKSRSKIRPVISHAATFTSGVSTLDYSASYARRQLGAPIFTPSVNAIRLDLHNYNKEFKGFIYTLIKPDFSLELGTLKKMRYFKTVWTEDLEPSFKVLPSALSGTSLMNRWQNNSKGFWNYVTDGKAIIEPVKAINESFKLAYRGQGLKGAPVAISNPCGFCGEKRDDKLEHSRLYFLKVLDDKPPSQHTGSASAVSRESSDENQTVRAEIPLCNCCLIKLRNICEFFAKLRSIHQNIYKLEQNDAYDQYAYVSGTGMSHFKLGASATKHSNDLASLVGQLQEGSPYESRRSSQETLSRVPSPGTNATGIQLWEEEAKIIKLYTLLNQIRSKIFWSRIGYWDVGSNEFLLNLDLVHYESFKVMTALHAEEEGDFDSIKGDVDASSVHSDPAQASRENTDVCEEPTLDEIRVQDESPQKINAVNTLGTQGTDRETIPNEEIPDAENGLLQSNDHDESGPNTLERKPSKSKKFTEKMNSDLEATMQMIQEVLKE